MSGRFEHFEFEGAPRKALFGMQLLDAVTLATVSYGIKVTAHGLRGKPVTNSSGLFVWLDEDLSRLEKVTIEPQALPYEDQELTPAELVLPPQPPPLMPLTTVELMPRADYAFAGGVTGVRGSLVEDFFDSPLVPVAGAGIVLQWLDDNGVWHKAKPSSRSGTKGGFVAILRLAPSDVPHINASGALTLRVLVKREGRNDRHTPDLSVPQGRVADPSTLSALRLAWDELEL